MRIQAGIALLMTENDDVAVTALLAGEFDDAVCNRFHARAGGRCVIDAGVRTQALQYRVKAFGGETG